MINLKNARRFYQVNANDAVLFLLLKKTTKLSLAIFLVRFVYVPAALFALKGRALEVETDMR